MASDHGTVARDRDPLDMLRRAQLAQTAASLRMAADVLDSLREDVDVADPLGDVAAYVRTIRADLEALEALGYGEPPDC